MHPISAESEFLWFALWSLNFKCESHQIILIYESENYSFRVSESVYLILRYILWWYIINVDSEHVHQCEYIRVSTYVLSAENLWDILLGSLISQPYAKHYWKKVMFSFYRQK